MNGLVLVIAVVATVWHGLLLRPMVRAARHRTVPLPVHMTILGTAIAMDIGLLLEGVGVPYEATGFQPFGRAALSTQLTVLLLLLFAPALLNVGAHLARGSARARRLWARPTLGRRQEIALVAATVGVAAMGIAFSAWSLRQGGNLPGARLVTSRTLGPLVILLYIPMGMAAFYACTENVQRSRWRRLMSLGVALVAGAATLALAQRSLLLLPAALVFLCIVKITPLRLVACGVAGLLAISSLAIITKPAGVSSRDRPSILATVNESLARGPVLARAVEESPMVGSSVMSYPGEGYVYAALFFVPRGVVPFKGEATAQRFTDTLEGKQRFGRWAFGLGLVEEVVLNVGLVPAGVVFVIWGYLLGALEAPMWRRPYLVPPVLLGSLWLGAYQLSAVLLLFGTTALVGLLCSLALRLLRPHGAASVRDAFRRRVRGRPDRPARHDPSEPPAPPSGEAESGSPPDTLGWTTSIVPGRGENQ